MHLYKVPHSMHSSLKKCIMHSSLKKCTVIEKIMSVKQGTVVNLIYLFMLKIETPRMLWKPNVGFCVSPYCWNLLKYADFFVIYLFNINPQWAQVAYIGVSLGFSLLRTYLTYVDGLFNMSRWFSFKWNVEGRSHQTVQENNGSGMLNLPFGPFFINKNTQANIENVSLQQITVQQVKMRAHTFQTWSETLWPLCWCRLCQVIFRERNICHQGPSDGNVTFEVKAIIIFALWALLTNTNADFLPKMNILFHPSIFYFFLVPLSVLIVTDTIGQW